MSFPISQYITAHILGSTCAWQNYVIFTPTAILHSRNYIRNTKLVQMSAGLTPVQQIVSAKWRIRAFRKLFFFKKSNLFFFNLSQEISGVNRPPQNSKGESPSSFTMRIKAFPDFQRTLGFPLTSLLLSNSYPNFLPVKREHILKFMAITQVELQNRSYYLNRVTIYYPEQLLTHKTSSLEHPSLHLFQIF